MTATPMVLTREMLERALENARDEPGRSDLPLDIALPGIARALRELQAGGLSAEEPVSDEHSDGN